MLDLPRELSGPQGPPVRVGAAALGVVLALTVVAAYALLCRLASWVVAVGITCPMTVSPAGKSGIDSRET